ncbi:Di-and tricarboxylate transporter [Catalinimonas alkaloidigena]|uniref:Di-and tricarboxylate transporter n=1 Tax=Catalinimonas alkaloidigena TaxID=1075417 RepID=A0A1G8XWC4_9BACT|nr:SLC13 family permease [Catalinimonas alkaloidigena]SDJ94484.1 Di-and tricarboxylate transporter [Catalinimonas alkaloidigena]
MQIALVLGLLILAIVLFATEKISVDLVTLFLLIILVASGIISVSEAYAGFSSDFIVILAAIFVVSGAMQDTGILDRLGVRMVRLAGKRPRRVIAYIMLITGAFSAFMNNTTVTALFVGPAMGWARRLKMPPSKLLMPLAFASILGGTCTLIGTSTNVAVSGYLQKTGMEPIGMFELLPVGAAIFVIGLVYMVLTNRVLMPHREEETLTEAYEMRDYLAEIVVGTDSALIGQRIFASTDLEELHLRVLAVYREDTYTQPDPKTIIQANDRLLVEGKAHDLARARERKNFRIKADMLTDEDLQRDKLRLAEVLVTPRSFLARKTLREVDFRRRYGLVVIAIHRFNSSLREKLGDVRLKIGDLLLVQGREQVVQELRNSRDLAVLGMVRNQPQHAVRGYLSLGAFVVAVLVGTIGWIPLSICFLAAAVFVVGIRTISSDRAYRLIDWRLLILIGGMSAFGTAMENSGTSEFLANGILDLFRAWGPTVIMAGFVVLTVFLTQPMSNAAAALVILPVALRIAADLEVNPRSFGIAIMLAASVSLITPFEPSCILVYGPGRYRFRDFLVVGTPLTLLLIVLIVVMVPIFWPF